MAYQNKKLRLEQVDEQLKELRKIELDKPPSGWINAIRTAISMSAKQLAKRLQISQQALSNLEKREVEETITIGKLREIGNALNLKLVYSFIPDNSLESMIDEQANKLARKIVMRTSLQMEIEDQRVEDKKLKKSIDQRAKEIARKMPMNLWD